MVPFVASTGPVLSNWPGPPKPCLVVEGGGPKYERSTLVPTEAGAGSKLQPGPGPIGPGPGPCAVLGFPAVVVSPKGKCGRWFSPVDRLCGVRSRGDSCAMAAMV